MEKKHLVVLLGGYKPMLSPGGLIMQRVIEAWGDRYDISVIASRNCPGLSDEEIVDYVRVYRVTDYNRLIHNTLTEKVNNAKSAWGKLWYRFLILMKQCVYYLYRCARSESLIVFYEKRLFRKIKEISETRKIDCVISVTEPHENSAAAYSYKKEADPDVIWLIYQLDRFANANSLYENRLARKIKEKRHYRREIEYLKLCDRLFVLKPIMEHYKQGCFRPYIDKITATDHPLMVSPDVTVTGSGDSTVRLIYAGSLDKGLRNPTVALQIMTEASKSADIVLDLYTFGNCGDIIERYGNTSHGVITNHKRVMRDELVRIIAGSDILVSIGNNSDNEVPSKFFDYISYGLPIVHFYFSDHDVIPEYLKKYPMSLCVKMDPESACENARRLVDFCRDAKGRIFGFEEIKKQYEECTPAFVADIIGGAI